MAFNEFVSNQEVYGISVISVTLGTLNLAYFFSSNSEAPGIMVILVTKGTQP